MRKAIYHIAREPKTGVWTVMTELGKYFSSKADFVESRVVIFGTQKDRDDYEQLSSRNGVEITYFQVPEFKFSYLTLLLDKRLSKWIYNRAVELNLDEVVLHFHNANLSGLFFPLPGLKKFKVVTVATFHGTPLVYPVPGKVKKIFHRLIGKILTRNKVQLVSVDTPGVEQASRIFGYSPSQFVVIPNGLTDPGIMHVSRTYSRQKFIVGFVGTFEQRKRWDLVLDAVMRLVAEKYPVELWLVGSGDKDTKARIQAFSKENPSWCFFKGNVPNAGVNIIPHLDVLVLPSKHEGMPMSVLEAMASGVVVISTPVSGLPEMIDDGETGFLINPEVDLIVNSIKSLIVNPILYKDLAERARKKYEKEFTIEICGNNYSKLYDHI